MAYALVSGIDRHQRSPNSFLIPSPDEKSAVKPGDYVKLIFSQGDESLPAERMWVKVTSREGDSLRGTLASEPYAVTQLAFNALIEFETDHIIAVLSEESIGGIVD
jgi:hypothetical protein